MEKHPNELKYCLTAFADILGYSEMIRECGNDYSRLSNKLKKIRGDLIEPQDLLNRGSHFDGRSVRFFSDCVFVNVPMRSTSPTEIEDGRSEIGHSLEDLACYQHDLALKGHFIRGCATVNFAYFDESIVFGSGVVEVVECEKSARYPRICLTKNLVSLVHHYCNKRWPGHENIASYIYRDCENRYFLNYLQVVNDYISYCCEPIPDEYMEYPLYKNVPDSIDLMKKHKENIETNIGISTDTSVLDKYIWLAGYHNFFCRKHFDECIELIIEGYDLDFYSFIESD
jgi:hypothetical protein